MNRRLFIQRGVALVVLLGSGALLVASKINRYSFLVAHKGFLKRLRAPAPLVEEAREAVGRTAFFEFQITRFLESHLRDEEDSALFQAHDGVVLPSALLALVEVVEE